MPGLNSLVQKFSSRGFAVVGFACNQFGLQMPGSSQEILNTFQYVRPGKGYKANFPIIAPLDVNGAKEDQIFTYIKSVCPSNSVQDLVPVGEALWLPIRSTDYEWNFEKVLIGRDGRAIYRYHPYTSFPPLLELDIISALNQGSE
eukprot:NODE_2126_length_1287_cov_88.850565_g1934_i0.p1 GENE.NODE_2126_length_1287_cov_88.850565_g1934_i0~~NODE_2126_length_1287_cov_88.850565_g1934_i0.p1  ORF type:complete len:145 (+),score=25.69 NODE_2126_length_1287_cov_88.850565_g1934_i0:546-980(+)